jgi:hypothetical protein
LKIRKEDKMKKEENKKDKKTPQKRIFNKNNLITLIITLAVLIFLSIIFKNMNLTTKAIEGECIPNWKCTQFLPEKCPDEGERTRICTDLNDCGMPQSMPSLEESCKPGGNYVMLIIIVILLLIILIVLIKILKRMINREKREILEHPKVEPKHYKHDPTYPSELEQFYASERTHDLKVPIPNRTTKKEIKQQDKTEDEGERYPENYWPK